MGVSPRHIKGKYSWLKHFDFLVIDMLALMFSFAVSYGIRFHSNQFFGNEEWRSILAIMCLLNLVIALLTGPYSGILRRYGSEEAVKMVLQALYNFCLCCLILYVMKAGATYSRIVIVSTYMLYAISGLLFRILWKNALRSGKNIAIGSVQKDIFVVGRRVDMPHLLRSINSGFFKEYVVKGVCVVDGEIGETVSAVIDNVDMHGKVQKETLTFQNQTTIDGIADFVLQERIDEVFISINPSNIPIETYHTLVAHGKGIHLNISPMIGFATDDQFITTVGTYKALSVGVYSFTGKQLLYLAVKRMMDILFSLIGLIALLPLMGAVKLSYVMTGDKAPIFYTQNRVGVNGKPFKLLKFRSMVSNADELLQEMLKDEKYRKEWEKNQKFEDDPRITKMGKFLRNTSLDEIPQFINVLRGDMSLIGPRPLVEGELEMHEGLQLYNQVKPGIAGWWGCNGRSNTTYDERLELEYYYVKNCSLYLDVLCIFKTIAAVLKRDGAV